MFFCILFSMRLKGFIVRFCESSLCECFRIFMSFFSFCSYGIVYFISNGNIYIIKKMIKKKKFIIIVYRFWDLK